MDEAPGTTETKNKPKDGVGVTASSLPGPPRSPCKSRAGDSRGVAPCKKRWGDSRGPPLSSATYRRRPATQGHSGDGCITVMPAEETATVCRARRATQDPREEPVRPAGMLVATLQGLGIGCHYKDPNATG